MTRTEPRHIEFTGQSHDGLPLYHQCWSPNETPSAVVCLVHGIGEHSGRYAHVAAALNDAGYVLLGFDLRGHGRSGGPRGHTPAYDDLMTDIDRLWTRPLHDTAACRASSTATAWAATWCSITACAGSPACTASTASPAWSPPALRFA